MRMDERRRRAWAALELGPRWALRELPAAQAEPPSGCPDASEAPRFAEAAETAVTLASGVPAVAGPASAGTEAGVARAHAIARMSWPVLAEAVAACTACTLCETRRRTVFGMGVQPAPWLFVGEAPGEQEDARGEPFVGRAGELLDGMLAAIGLKRDRDVFIANVLKCRPPRNRDPLPEEVSQCEPFLLRQMELVQPRVVVALGRFAARSLLRTDEPIARLRGRTHRLRVGERDIPLVVTYHPAYLLRNLPDKSRAWSDLRLARRMFETTGGSEGDAGSVG